MDKKQLLFLLGGLALGYLAFKTFSAKEKGETSEEGTNGVAEVNPKIAECQAKLNEALKLVRTSDIEGYKTKFMADCMSNITAQ